MDRQQDAESVRQVGDNIYQRNGVGFDVAARKSDDEAMYEGWVYLGVEPLFHMVEPVSMSPASIEDFANIVLRRFAKKLAENLGYDEYGSEHNDGPECDE